MVPTAFGGGAAIGTWLFFWGGAEHSDTLSLIEEPIKLWLVEHRPKRFCCQPCRRGRWIGLLI